MTIIRIEDPSIFIGMPYEKAVGQITDSGYTPVLVKSDNVTRELIKDYDPLRVLLHTKRDLSRQDIVTFAKIG